MKFFRKRSEIDERSVFEMGESSDISAGVKFFISENVEVTDCVVSENELITDSDGFQNKNNPDHAMQENVDLLALVRNFPIQTENIFKLKFKRK